MSDLIYRQDAIDQLHQSYNLLDAEQRLEDLPSAQTERKKGKWIVQDIYQKEMYRVSCSCCGESSMVDQRSIAKAVDIKVYNFCPSCGADMRGEIDE